MQEYDNMNNCEWYDICRNNNKCYRCADSRLLKTAQKHEDSGLFKRQNKKIASSNNSWEDLEQQVADKLNRIPTIQEARRSRASGALPFEKGDIVDAILHPECKERMGRDLKTGEKSMSIKREWLEKAKKECRYENKSMCLPFRFKEDENIYCIMDMDDIASLVTTLKSYMQENERLSNLLKSKDSKN